MSFDNQQTIMLLANLKFHSKDKLIDIQYHFIREEVQMKERIFHLHLYYNYDNEFFNEKPYEVEA